MENQTPWFVMLRENENKGDKKKKNTQRRDKNKTYKQQATIIKIKRECLGKMICE